jgi:hypothetical protein
MLKPEPSLYSTIARDLREFLNHRTSTIDFLGVESRLRYQLVEQIQLLSDRPTDGEEREEFGAVQGVVWLSTKMAFPESN